MSTGSASMNTSGSPGAEEILTEIHDNLLECKVCFETFSLQQREHRPQNLSCGHVLCLECVYALSKPFLDRLECPFCKRPCDVGGISDCWALTDLQDLLLYRSPRSPRRRLVREHESWGKGLGSGSLHLTTAFGGWGRLINPTGLATFETSGAIVVVHAGDKRVTVHSSTGKHLHGFGQAGHGSKELCHPLDVAVAPGGHIVVTDAGDSSVKVFSSRGRPIVTIQEPFQLPWGTDVDTNGRILVTDTKAGTLTQVVMDFSRRVICDKRVVLTGLQCPRSVAICPVTGNTAVLEHLEDCVQSQGGSRPKRLQVFGKDFTLLSLVDSFSLTSMTPGRLSISSVAFDRVGNVIVSDTQQGAIWSLGTLPKTPVLTPLVCEGLVYPVGLVVTAQNTLIVLDSGDHTVKLYSLPS
ncbi:E3 ubiquitin-protein ligase NHLRC1-like [Chanos chanos]|uniref:RING-type E3 ubiquitin transferase n=1 Tax=Chanos chanos TaxID=29144 RepID=A0A6J2W1X9_CHACN|nr:E3 ubiquitin-protein ligase NHLRC1 [Chanos chanos]